MMSYEFYLSGSCFYWRYQPVPSVVRETEPKKTLTGRAIVFSQKARLVLMGFFYFIYDLYLLNLPLADAHISLD